MSYKFFTTSKKAWHGMYKAIKEAKVSIYLEMYIFNNDTEINFLEILKEKAKKGLRIKIILDSLGSVDFKNKYIEELKNAGVEIIFVSHFLHRMHKKILIIDEKIAFLGGVNIHQSAVDWDDLAVSFSGKMKIKYVVSMFAKDYMLAGGKDEFLIKKIKQNFLKKTKEKFFDHLPYLRKFFLKDFYKKHLALAEREVLLVTPYFAPRRYLVAYLEQCVLRGVSVLVMVPEKTDAKIFDKANRFYMAKYQKIGIKFLFVPKMNHAKLLLVDQKTAILGSQNFDFLSFDLNSETGMIIDNSSGINDLKKIIQKWTEKAFVFDLEKHKLSKIDLFLSKILDFFVSFL